MKSSQCPIHAPTAHTLNAHKCTSQTYGQCDDSAYVWNTSSTSFRISRHLDSTFHKILHKYHTHKKKNEWPYLNIHIGFIFFLNLNFAFCLRDFFLFGKKYFSWIWLRVLIARSKRHTFSVVGHSSVSLYLVGNFSFYLTMSSNLFFIFSSLFLALSLQLYLFLNRALSSSSSTNSFFTTFTPYILSYLFLKQRQEERLREKITDHSKLNTYDFFFVQSENTKKKINCNI